MLLAVPVDMTSHTCLEAYRDPVQICPARSEQQAKEDSLHTFDRQALPHNVPCSAQDAAQRPLLVLVKVIGSSVIVLEGGDELLHQHIVFIAKCWMRNEA